MRFTLALLAAFTIGLGLAAHIGPKGTGERRLQSDENDSQTGEDTCQRDWDVRLSVVEILDNLLNPPRAFGVVQVFRDTILDAPYGEGSVIGFNEGQCIWTVVTEDVLEQKCDLDIVFTREGTNTTSIIISGHWGNDNPTLAITGGTGDYTGANGYAFVELLPDTPTGLESWNYHLYFDILECCQD